MSKTQILAGEIFALRDRYRSLRDELANTDRTLRSLAFELAGLVTEPAVVSLADERAKRAV